MLTGVSKFTTTVYNEDRKEFWIRKNTKIYAIL